MIVDVDVAGSVLEPRVSVMVSDGSFGFLDFSGFLEMRFISLNVMLLDATWAITEKGSSTPQSHSCLIWIVCSSTTVSYDKNHLKNSKSLIFSRILKVSQEVLEVLGFDHNSSVVFNPQLRCRCGHPSYQDSLTFPATGKDFSSLTFLPYYISFSVIHP